MSGDRAAADGWTAPDRDVRATAREYLDAGDPAMLATVVDVDGRAYRRPGAKAVVSPDGGGTGAITAGCLTDEVRRLARDVLDDDRPRVERFDLSGDGDAWGLGVGCNGVVELLCEPLGDRHRPLVDVDRTGDGDGGGRSAAVTSATVIESGDDRLTAGDRTYVDAPPSAAGVEEFPPALADAVRTAADERDGEFARTVETESERGRVRAFVERVTPPPTLLVVGSGQDVRPVVELGRKAGFRVVVAGFRGGRATTKQFPEADRVVATSPRDLTDAVAVDGDTYAVVMTHNFVDDRLAVLDLLDSPAPYVGLMGPSDRFEMLREAAERDGESLPDDAGERLYTPVGLDLGGGSPYQVGQSIVAEVLAVTNGHEGGHLRASGRPIHGRDE